MEYGQIDFANSLDTKPHFYYNKNGENSGHEFFDDKRVLAAVEYIRENCFYGITVSDVASHVFISTKQLQRIFEKELHKTPSRFLLEYKMSRVRELLDETDIQFRKSQTVSGFQMLIR